MEVFNLDIIPGKSVPVIHASQYDKGREFRANLFERSAVYTLAGTETLNVYVRKPDGNMVTLNVTNTSSDYITFKTTEQTTACDGANLCELRITKGADIIGTANFILECEKSPDTGITSQTEINNLETLVDGFTALAVADQYDSANVIFDNAPTIGHGNGYAVTSDGLYSLLTRTDITSLVTFNENVTGTSTEFFVKNNVLYIFYQGESKAHSANDLLFTLPSGYRPSKIKYTPFLASNGVNFIVGDVYINIDGTCKVNQISDNSGAGRVYLDITLPLA